MFVQDQTILPAGLSYCFTLRHGFNPVLLPLLTVISVVEEYRSLAHLKLRQEISAIHKNVH